MEEDYNIGKRVNRIGFSLLAMVLAIFISQVLIDFLVKMIAPDLKATDWYIWAVTAITMVGIGLPVIYSIGRSIPSYNQGEVKKLKLSEFGMIFIISAALMYVSNYVGVFINLLISMLIGRPLITSFQDIILNSNMLFTFLYGCIVAPIVEELIFRKLLLSKLRYYGDLPAILYTGIAFGLIHMNLSQFFYATTLGIVFAYVTIRTNTIKYSIILHMMINFIGGVIAPLVLKSQNLGVIMLIGIWVITAITLGIVLLILNFKKIKLVKPPMAIQRKSVFLFNIGTVLFIGFCMVNMALSILNS
jgi:membrane protease YdiL (CAAX protease family)